MTKVCKPQAIDLFSGCGGLTVGLKSAGFRVVGAVEVDPLAASTYRANHPKVRTWERDIKRLSASHVMRSLRLQKGSLDLLAGCPPCQGFSSMRTLNGRKRIRDKQNDLLFQFERFVRVMLPKAIMLENVPKLEKNWRMREFKRTLTKMGYQFKAGVLDAADFGVPQRRRRFILVALREGTPRFAEPQSRKVTVREAIGSLPAPGKGDDPLQNIGESRAPHVRELIRRIPKNGGSRLSLRKSDQLACHRNCNGFYDVYGRMAWRDVAPTITGGCVNPSKGRFLHPSQDRAITLREAALLQSFPPRYKFKLEKGKFAVAQMIGNALPSEFVRQHAALLKSSLSQK